MAAGEMEFQEGEETVDYHKKLRQYIYGSSSGDGKSASIEDLKSSIETLGGKVSQEESIDGDSIDGDMETKLNAEKELSQLPMDAEVEHSKLPVPVHESTAMEGEQHSTPPLDPSCRRASSLKDLNIISSSKLLDVDTIRQLRTTRDINRSLADKLNVAEQQYELLTQSKEDLRLELDAQLTARGATLVEKIYSAQKVREEAFKSRLKRMTDEKDELAKKLKKMEKDNGADSGVETNSLGDELWLNADMSLDEIVGRVVSGKHSQSIEFNGEVVLDRGGSGRSHNFKRRSSSNEYKKLKEERDTALLQVEQVTEELHKVQREQNTFESQHRKHEKSRIKLLQNQMKGVIRERDKATAKNQHVEEELEHLRLQLSLKKSLSGDIGTSHRSNKTLDEYKVKLKEAKDQLATAQLSYDDLHSKTNRLVTEKNEMALQLQDALVKSKEDKKRAEKLERLLVALRRRKER